MPDYNIPEAIVDGDPGQIDWAILVAESVNQLGLIVDGLASNDFAVNAPSTDRWARITINDDGSSTATWIDRFQVVWNPQTGADRPTFWLNEYGEGRGMPAKDNTVGYRIFAALDAAGYTARSSTIPAWEVTDKRDGTRNTVLGVMKNGELSSWGSTVGFVSVLEATEDLTDINPNLPNGTLFVRKLS